MVIVLVVQSPLLLATMLSLHTDNNHVFVGEANVNNDRDM
jgi:hypothetical protein